MSIPGGEEKYLFITWGGRLFEEGLLFQEIRYTYRPKVFDTIIYPCVDCAIYRLNFQLGAKMVIERYQKVCCVSINLGEIFLIFCFPKRC